MDNQKQNGNGFSHNGNAGGSGGFANQKNVEFEVHMLNETGKRIAGEISDTFNTCFNKLATICPIGREWSIVRTKLEEACFYAKKSMALTKDYQQY